MRHVLHCTAAATAALVICLGWMASQPLAHAGSAGGAEADPVSCTEESDCSEGEVCQSGLCARSCQTSDDCEDGEECVEAVCEATFRGPGDPFEGGGGIHSGEGCQAARGAPPAASGGLALAAALGLVVMRRQRRPD